ncbi:MAG TPA: type II toxin-antitoxin system RatA family toxin [Caldimonas sp.]|nr:type II toxin-antitoxin system RatA family toxin [Caldimonas sp.]
MKQVKKSVLLWYSAHEIYELVVDAEAYPQFLPWCERAEILERDEHGSTARLHLAYAGLRHAFTTRNEMVKDESVRIGLVDGPFSLLDGMWRFVPLSLPSAPDPALGSACKIEFEMRYAFSNRVLEAAISPVFDRIANTFVDSFVRRAEQVHGPR